MADNSSTEGTAPRQYVVVARRYRPQSFDELIGQEHVAKGLAAAIVASRVGHAYLFTGARGTGKTSTARILAKALNCEKGPTPTPCNECDICRSITAGDDMDVLEIDGASNRGIDEIRQLRQNVNVRPSRARFKIYIIDEVHMLTKEAFNALLKTLEEPPEHVKFIFCTTEPEKIPITIISRCQRYDFAGIQTSQIVERLRQIVAGEGVEAEPEALEILARRAAGSMRDSQSLLEQLLAFGSRKITVADVHRLLGTAGSERIAQPREPFDRTQRRRRTGRSRSGHGRRNRRRPTARSTVGLFPRRDGRRRRLPRRLVAACLDVGTTRCKRSRRPPRLGNHLGCDANPRSHVGPPPLSQLSAHRDGTRPGAHLPIGKSRLALRANRSVARRPAGSNRRRPAQAPPRPPLCREPKCRHLRRRQKKSMTPRT